MKTIIRKVNFRYFFRRSLYLLVISFLLAGCEEEASLSARSVVEAGETERERAELDKWILDTFTRPYGIRWNIGGTKMQCRMEAISTRRKLPM
jgi:hypothetical protein